MSEIVTAATEVTPRLGVLSEGDQAALRRAVRTLERPSLAARLSGLAGAPLELLGRAVPKVVSDAVARATQSALQVALKVALRTLPARQGESGLPGLPPAPSGLLQDGSGLKHKAMVAVSGALGGAFGVATLPLELPLSTTIMLRAIAEIARDEGEDLSRPEAALACVQVFALGSGRAESDDFAESAYFTVRSALARSIAEAGRYVAQRGVLEEGAPALIRFAAQIASRFGLVVSQKVAAQAVPVIGALGGAAVNTAFMDHFQAIARAHFTVRRLERSHGKEIVRAAYEDIRARDTA